MGLVVVPLPPPACEKLRFINCSLASSSSSSPSSSLAAAGAHADSPLSSSSDGGWSRGFVVAGRGCQKQVVWKRQRQQQQHPQTELLHWSSGGKHRQLFVHTPAPSSSSTRSVVVVSYGGIGAGAGAGAVTPSLRLERISSTLAVNHEGNRRRRGLVAPGRAVPGSATTTISPESRVGGSDGGGGSDEGDEELEETLALARAAATAARDAARDAAAFAEAQAVGDNSVDDDPFRAFPSEQDLLLLERARLTEMARSGAVPVLGRDEMDGKSEEEGFSPNPNSWKVWQFSTTRELDAALDFAAPVPSSTLKRGGGSEKEAMARGRTGGQRHSSVAEESRSDGGGVVTVRSNRRQERLMKRERAMMRADVAAAASSAATSASSSSKVKKPQMSTDLSDPVRAYLRDVWKMKLLTEAEEARLATGIQDLLMMENVKADFIEQMGREPSELEWAKAVGLEHESLESRIKSGQACKDKMVNSNLRLVVSIAKRYQNRGMTLQDLIQEGSMGLIRGAEKFDHTRGFKFSTYAYWWIRQAITRAIADQSRTIRLPVHVYEMLSRITKAKSMLAAEHGRVPRDEEVAELVGLNLEKLKLVIKSAKSPKSMEFPVGKNNDTTLGEIIADRDVESPEDAISKRLLKQDMNAVLNTLNPRERDVLRLRYGLDDGRMRTLEEIGSVFHVTRERIRQIEAKALRKLRQPSRNTALREYLDLK